MNQVLSISHNSVSTLPLEFTSIATILQLDAQLLGDYTIKAVDARQLHGVLEIGRDFSSWVKYQIERCILIESEDYEVVLPTIGEQEIRGKTAVFEFIAKTRMKNPPITYRLTIEAAKKMAILSQTKAGDLVWKYFLHMEKVAQQAYHGKLPSAMLPTELQNQGANEFSTYMGVLSVLEGAGFGAGYAQKMAYDLAERTDRKYGTCLTALMPVRLAAQTQVETLDPRQGQHLLRTQAGGVTLNSQELAARWGLKSSTELYTMLCKAGICSPVHRVGYARPSGYTLTARYLAREYKPAILSTAMSGPCKGKLLIKAWILTGLTDSDLDLIQRALK